MHDDDLRLAKQLARGNKAAGERLVTDHYQPVFRFCLSMIHNFEDAQDLTQNSLVQACKQANKFRGDSSLRTWLLRIAYRELLILNRKSRKLAPLDLDSRSVKLDSNLRMEQFLNRLSFDHRTAIVLSGVIGLESAEIAKILEIPEGTVKSRVHHAREKLRQMVDEEQEELNVC